MSEQLVFLWFLSLASGHDFTVKENERFLTLLYICCRYEAFSEELQIYKRGDFLLNQQSSQRGFPSPPFPAGRSPGLRHGQPVASSCPRPTCDY